MNTLIPAEIDPVLENEAAEKPAENSHLNVVTLYFHSKCLYDLGDITACLLSLKAAHELAPTNLDILYRYAVVSAEAGHTAVVKELCDRMIGLDGEMKERMEEIYLDSVAVHRRKDQLNAPEVGIHVPPSWNEYVHADERKLRYALTQNPGNAKNVRDFEELMEEKERVRSNYGGGNKTPYKLH